MAQLAIGQQRFRRSWRQICAIALAALLAACATGRGPVKPTPGPAAGPAPAKPAVSEAEKQRVAVLVPTTGGNAALGQSIANAANLALLDSGSQRIRLTIYNTGPSAGAAARKALAEGNRLIIGPLLAGEVREVKAVASAANVPVLAFSNDSALAGGGTYILGFQPRQSIDRVVQYARGQGIERFAALVPAGDYGQRASSAYLDAVKDAGGRMTAIAPYARDSKSLSAAVRKLTGGSDPSKVQMRPDGTVARVDAKHRLNFDALLIADSGKIAIAALPALTKSGVSGIRLLGTELWNTEPGLAQVAGMQGAWFASVPDGTFRQFSTHYRGRFGSAPYRLASLGYDAVLLVNRIATRWPAGKPFPEAALRDRDGFSGIDGIFRFGEGAVALRALEVQQIDAGGFSVLSPAARSFGN